MNKKHFVKFGCAFLAGSMLTSLCGCAGKATPANFRNLEKKLGATVYEVEDEEDMRDIFNDDDYSDEFEEGVIMIFSEDAISDFYDEALSGSSSEVGSFMELYYGDNFDPTEDITSVQMYFQGNPEMRNNESSDIEYLVSVMAEYKDKKTADYLFADMIDNIDGIGWVTKFIGQGVSVSDFNRNEYSYRSGSSGHFIYNFNFERFCEALERNEAAFDLMDIDVDDFIDEFEDEAEDLIISLGVYYSGNTITYVIAVSNTGDGLDNLAPLCSTLGLKNPTTVTNSDAMDDMFSTLLVPYVSSISRYLSRAAAASEMYSIDPEEIAQYVDDAEDI